MRIKGVLLSQRITKYAPVAQLDRVTDSDSVGRWFESSRAYQNVLMKDAAQKTPHESAVFLHLYRLFYGGKVRKSDFSRKQFFPATVEILEMQPVVIMDWCDSNTEA